MAGCTIREVARAAGVSTATVSRVINGNSRVTTEVATRVRETVDLLGYVPNVVARSLKSDRTGTIGMLVSDIGNSYFSAMAKALEDLLAQHGYTLLIGSTEENPDREAKLLAMMMGRKVEGLLLNTTGRNEALVAGLSRRVPIVLLNRRVHSPGFQGDLVDSANRVGVGRLVACLSEAGHSRIGVINGDLTVSTGAERYAGFLEAMKKSQSRTAFITYRCHEGNFSMESGRQGAAALLEGPETVSALVVMNNSMALGVLRYCRKMGVRIPEQLSLGVYGNLEEADLLYVRPTHVSLHAAEMAKNSSEFLLERIINPLLASREVLLDPVLCQGDTIAPPRSFLTKEY